ncbi:MULTISPECIES: hypothetical protein [unclassified Streptomyces]|uniref:hypothetical protein n=1 Tax=unclassified Streptomyces TaxID=2593676 RepID=UPI0008DCBB9F|nr:MULTISPECIES: hypothetical protein [unclassified Streptomyces]OII59780.1 hypothetical protein BJP39_11505 [Streptomyces sp. CC77]
MKFLLEVTVDGEASAETTARELGRILRYWGGSLHHYAMKPGDGSAVHDSAYREVGRWRLVADGEPAV